MASLYVKKLFLWPRFQASVISTMERHAVDVVEMYVQLTPSMLACQTALLDLIDACIKELRRCNVTVSRECAQRPFWCIQVPFVTSDRRRRVQRWERDDAQLRSHRSSASGSDLAPTWIQDEATGCWRQDAAIDAWVSNVSDALIL